MSAAWMVTALYVPAPVETLHVDRGCYLESLSLLGDAWESRLFCRFARVAEMVMNADPRPFELAAWLGGREAWARSVPDAARLHDHEHHEHQHGAQDEHDGQADFDARPSLAIR